MIDGTVARITPYGAFLQLEDGRLGLVHISEVDRNYVKDVHDHLREGDVVQAKVVAIKEDGKIDLSIKALQDPAPPRARRGSDPEFEQMLKKFMRQSEERLVDYKRAVEHSGRRDDDRCAHDRSSDETVSRALERMQQGDVRRLPVVDGDLTLGIVSLGDLSSAVGAGKTLADISNAAPDL